MIDIAYAMAPKVGENTPPAAWWQNPIFMMVIIAAIFYFLLIRPQQKKAKAHRELLAGIKKGDKVVSNGGLHGVVTGITDDIVTMEIAPKVRVKVSRGSIAGIGK